jgi:hypothetical protein
MELVGIDRETVVMEVSIFLSPVLYLYFYSFLFMYLYVRTISLGIEREGFLVTFDGLKSEKVRCNRMNEYVPILKQHFPYHNALQAHVNLSILPNSN